MGTGRLLFFLFAISLLLVSTFGAVFFLTERLSIVAFQTKAPPPVIEQKEIVSPPVATSTLWFVGDVMLSRQVRERMEERNADFPWLQVRDSFAGSAVVVNFESCLSETKVFDYSNTFRFPVPAKYATSLKSNGVTHVSLANNHALDCGQADLEFTREKFLQSGITPFGHPVTISDASVAYYQLGKYQIALIGIHTLFSEPPESTLRALLASTTAHSDMQIVFVHWGDEYEPFASTRQRTFATVLARFGVDIIIGHHPHVVQPIEQIGQTLVVYSLGNFIFDQYFSEAVQLGLTTRLEVGNTVGLSLHPVTSIGTKNQPHFMSATGTRAFFTDLAKRSDTALQDQIMAGYIDLSFLATSSKSAIITQ